MQITQDLGKYQLMQLVFMEDAVAASQTDAQLSIADVGTAQLNNSYIMPWKGYIIGLSYALNTAATAGSMTIGSTIAGTECTDPTLTVTTESSGYDTAHRLSNPFAAGAAIGAEITTSADWNGTASDLVVSVWVLLDITGI